LSKKCTDFQKSRCCGESGRPLLFDPSNPNLASASLLGLFLAVVGGAEAQAIFCRLRVK
jgi:hypothetical protein